MQFKPALFLIASALVAASAFATPIAQWDFNNSSTKHTFSMNGASFATVGGVTTAFASGTSDKGSSDKGSPNSALNTTNYGSGATAGTTGNMTRGVQFMIDTSGYQDLVFSFDQRNSNTGSAWLALLYTLDDGESWTKATQFQISGTNFLNNRSYSFADIDGADNNPLFGVQLVAMFAPGTSSYVGAGGAFGTSGTIRYDMVTLSGIEIPEVIVDVPEPGSVALLMAGLGGIGMVSRRRRSN